MFCTIWLCALAVPLHRFCRRSRQLRCICCKRSYTSTSEHRRHITPNSRKKEIDESDRKVEEYTRQIKKDADEKVREIQKKAVNQVNAVRSETSEKIDEIKRNEQRRYKEEVLNKIPFYLRWIVERYFK